VHPDDFIEFRSFAVYYEIIRLIRRRYPRQFAWKQPPYEFEHNRLPIDMINASDSVRIGLEHDVPFHEIESSVNEEIMVFRNAAADSLMY